MLDQPLKQWLTKRKREEDEIKKFEYLENEKSFLDKIKKHFSHFLKGYHLVINKNSIKNGGHKL